MKKKIFASVIVFTFFTLFLISSTFAAVNMDNAVNGVRNFVGGTENVVENAGKGITNGIKDGMNAVGNDAKNMTNGVKNGVNGMATTGTNLGTNNMRTNYTTTRTATNTGNAMFGNVSNSVWTWMIVAIVGIIIVALVMYYAKQNTNVTTYNDDDE